jgi:mersacidin/lichenicidin family type 2 lantibiotic
MTTKIIRAWKDQAYRSSLSEQERIALPANPAGPVFLDEAQLAGVIGGVAERSVPTTRVSCPQPTASWICDYHP